MFASIPSGRRIVRRHIARAKGMATRVPALCLGALLASVLLAMGVTFTATGRAQETATAPRFKVIAFYTGVNDLAHVSFVKEAKPLVSRNCAHAQLQLRIDDGLEQPQR